MIRALPITPSVTSSKPPPRTSGLIMRQVEVVPSNLLPPQSIPSTAANVNSFKPTVSQSILSTASVSVNSFKSPPALVQVEDLQQILASVGTASAAPAPKSEQCIRPPRPFEVVGLKPLIKEISREVLRHNPIYLYQFIADYLDEKVRERGTNSAEVQMLDAVQEQQRLGTEVTSSDQAITN